MSDPSPELWRAAVEASQDAVFELDRDGLIATWTATAARLFGYPSERAVGQPISILTPQERAGHEALVARALAGERVERLAVDARRSDGLPLRVSLTLVPLDGGNAVCVVAHDLTERTIAQETLAESELRLREAQELSHVGLWLWDQASDSVQLSDQLYRILGLSPLEFPGSMAAYLDVIHGDDRSGVERDLVSALDDAVPFDREFRVVLPDRAVRWLYARATIESDADGTPVGLRGIAQDITERKEAAEALARQASLLELLRRMAIAANEALTLEEALRVCVRQICTHTQWPVGHVHYIENGEPVPSGIWHDVGGQFAPLLSAIEGASHLEAHGPMTRVLRARRPRWTAELSSLDSPLGQVATRVGVDSAVGFPLVVDDEIIAVVEFFWSSEAGATELDDQLVATLWDGVNQLGRVVERVRARDELSHQALHDALTGLPNRALLLDRLAHALERQRREPSYLAVIFVDLDNFKLVNDSLGHDAGDRLLVTIARRLRRMIRPDDTAARFGGDEFIILCDRLPSEEVAVDMAERILAGLAAPVSLDRSNEAVIRASAGIAIAHGPDASPEALLRDADSAMYRAKEAGRGRYQVFDAAMHQRATERLAIANELRSAIEQGELRLVYQPQIDLATKRIVGVEALVRWAHPTRGLLGPVEFIGVAEETQLIVPLGSWVIWEACRQAASWAERHPAHPDLQLCVNVSAQQLGRAELVDAVRGALHETGLDPGCLHLEITESVLMGESDFFLEALLGLKLLGVKIAIDDFGTGYSSLAYLRRFPIDVIKVDKGFVDGLGTDDSRAHAVVAAVIDLAHALELTAVAEGVETPQQVAILHRLGCDIAQGFHFDRPLPPAEVFERLMADTSPDAR